MSKRHWMSRVALLFLVLPLTSKAQLPPDLPTDPQGIADYLNELASRETRYIEDPETGTSYLDYSSKDKFDNIVADLPSDVMEEVREIWEAEEEADLKRQMEQGAAQQLLSIQLSPEQWVHTTANFFISAQLDPTISIEGTAGQQLIDSRSFYADKLQALAQESEFLTTAITVAGAELKETEAAITRADGWIWNDSDLEQLTETAETLRTQINSYQLQLGAANGAYGRTLSEAAGYERTLVIQGLADNDEARAAEEERRYQEAVRLTNELAANRVQMVEGMNAWDFRISEATDPDQIARLEEARDLWLSGQQVELYGRGQDLARHYTESAGLGIGAGNDQQLLGQVVGRGLDVRATLEADAIENLESTSEYMFNRVTVLTGGAARTDSFDHSFSDFIDDAGEGIYEAYFTYDGAVAYYERLGNYGLGLGEVVWDAGTGLADLGFEVLIDTPGELLTPTFVDDVFDPFGDDNLAAGWAFADSAPGLADEVLRNTAIMYNDQYGLGLNIAAPETQVVFDTTQGLFNHASRALEQGNANDMSRWLGYGIGTAGTFVVAPEVELAKAVAITARAAPKAVNALRTIQRGETATEAAANVIRHQEFVDVATSVASHEELVTAWQRLGPDAPAGLPEPTFGALDAPTPLPDGPPVTAAPGGQPVFGELDAPTPLSDGAPPAAAPDGQPVYADLDAPTPRPGRPPMAGISPSGVPTQPAQLLDGPNGLTLQIGGEEFVLEPILVGAGGFTDVYKVQGANLVVKHTKATPGSIDDLITAQQAVVADNMGNAALAALGEDVVKVPTVFHQGRLTPDSAGAGYVTVAEFVPEPTLAKQIIGAGRTTPTARQQAGLDRLHAAAAEADVVLFDGKLDNIAMGDDGIAIVVDGGGTFPVRPGTAPEIRADLDVVPEVVRNAEPHAQRATWMQFMQDNHGDKVLWDVVAGEGLPYASLNDGFYNPLGAVKQAELNSAIQMSGRTPSLTPLRMPTDVPTGLAPAVATAIPQPISASPAFDRSTCLTPPDSAFATSVRVKPPLGPLGRGGRYLQSLGFNPRDISIFDDRLFDAPVPTAFIGQPPVSRPPLVVNPEPYCSGFGAIGRAWSMVDANAIVANVNLPTGTNGLIRSICIGRQNMNGTCPDDAPLVSVVNENIFSPTMVAEAELLPNPFRTEQAVNDPLFNRSGSWGQAASDQWAIQAVGIDEDLLARGVEEGESVVVAVIDTGLAWSHPDIDTGSIWINRDEIVGNHIDDDGNGYIDDVLGWNFVDDNNLAWDLDGHGTLVSGIIVASSNNEEGMTGMNPQAKVMVLRALDERGNTRASYVAEAIVYAANNGARVINLSVGGATKSPVEQMAVDYARSQGVVVIAAAGNQGTDLSGYGPGGEGGVITVAATGYEGDRLASSNWGPQVDIAAPGQDVLGPRALGTDLMAKFEDIEYEPGENIVGENRKYYRATGTSFSAPIVAGAASLLFSQMPTLSGEQVERMILNSAQDIESPGIDQYSGYGLLDLRAALEANPEFYIEASIDGVAVVELDGAPYLQVLGSASANELDEVELQYAPANSDRWETVDREDDEVVDEVLGIIPAVNLQGATEWVLRVVTRHSNGQEREAQFLLTLG